MKKKVTKNKDFYGKVSREEYRTLKEGKSKRRIVIIAFSMVVLLFFLVTLSIIYTPNIIIKGSNKMKLTYNKKYHDPGYTATYLGKDVSDDVKVKGKVNPKKLGTYTIKYSIRKGVFSKSITRTVIVLDNKKPKITLEEGNEVLVCPYDEYKESGYKAIDNYDGNITKKVKVTKTPTKYIYEVMDSSGNIGRTTRKIIYGDREKPEITLKDGKKRYSFIHDDFKPSEVEIKDNCDKDIKNKLRVSSGVNKDKLGVYQVIYLVTDASGNETQITQEVEIIERGKNGTVYLTFDDGPKDGTTNVILDILKEENVKATFFVTGHGPDNLIQREANEGHTVALHTNSHNYALLYASAEAYFNDLNAVSSRVERLTGIKAKIIRFPGGSSNTVSARYVPGLMTTLTAEVKNRGYRYYDWNIASGDSDGINSPDGIYENVTRQLSKDRVNMILFHDIKPQTRDSLKRIIQFGKQNGYAFDKITDKTDEIHQHVNN